MKRFLSLFLALVMSFALAVPAFAAGPADPGEGEIVIEPRISPLMVNQVITPTGAPWDQTDGYKYYRVWVYNTSSTTMKVTLEYPDGTFETKSLAAGDNKILFESDNAVAGRYWVHFSNENGNVSGTVRVRMSNLPL